jgi:prepilin-type N-terminal cleavage/methylation domain-containing protein
MSCNRRGFTLLEMTIAMTITAVTGLSVAGVTMALGEANDHGQDFYQSVQTGRSAVMKIQAIVRGAKLVTASTGTSLVLWLEDANGDGQVNLSETVLLTFDAESGEIRFYRVAFPETMDQATRQALDVTKPLVDIMNISGVTDTITGNAYNDLTVLATDVTAFSVSVWPAVPLTRLVRFQLTVGTGSSAVTLRSAASTRAGATGYVQVVENEYVLTSPD